MPHHERLEFFFKEKKRYVLQIRRERYCNIYDWKIIEGMVPNFHKPFTTTRYEGIGGSCDISYVNVGHAGTLTCKTYNNCVVLYGA